MNLFKTISKKAGVRLRHWSHARFKERVLVIESDDWGMIKQPCADLLRNYGEPNEWADEATESVEDLKALYEALSEYRDLRGRPVCVTSNFILTNPDFQAIERAKYTAYHDLDLKQSIPKDVIDTYLSGITQKVFFPQHHGLRHFEPKLWLKDLQYNQRGARELLEKRCAGGLSLLRGEGWRYHSEYLNWQTGMEQDENLLLGQLRRGIQIFKEVFNYAPASTIAPHYIFTPLTMKAWKSVGIRYIQGASYHLVRGSEGQKHSMSHYLGEKSEEGLLYLTRNIKFDPRPERPDKHWNVVCEDIEEQWEDNVPVVLDSHRINYTGKYRREGVKQLSQLLDRLRNNNALYLTTTELAEAIENQGRYKDAFDGTERSLTPVTKLMSGIAKPLIGKKKNANR